MQGIHFTVIGAILVVAAAYWVIKYSQGTYTFGTEATKSVANVPRAFTKGTGAP